MKIRDVCKPTETQVDPVALGLQGPPGSRGPGLTTKDAGGKVVGVAVAPSQVAMSLNGQQVVFQVMKSTGFVEDSVYGNFFFANPDCTGQALLDGSVSPASQELLFTEAIQVFRGVAYYPTEPIMFGTAQSQLAQADEVTCMRYGGTFADPDLCCYPASASGVQALNTFDLRTLALTPPFHVEGP